MNESAQTLKTNSIQGSSKRPLGVINQYEKNPGRNSTEMSFETPPIDSKGTIKSILSRPKF